VAKVHGKSGSVTYTNITAATKAWTLNYTCDVDESTDWAAAATGKTFMAGVTSWTATVEAYYDNTNTAAPGDSATLTLIPTTNLKYEGTAIMTSMRVSAAVDGGVDTMTYEFQGTGALTIDTTA